MGAPDPETAMRAYLAKLREEIDALRRNLDVPEPRNVRAES